MGHTVAGHAMRRPLSALVAAALLVAAGSHRSAASAPGLQGGPAPWSARSTALGSRVAALRLPAKREFAFHTRVLVRIFVDGRPVRVPARIGVDPHGRLLAPLHTHDASGTVDVEADRPMPFTLGQFFTVWGVRFTDTGIGGYADGMRVYADGERVAHPVAHVLRTHERIVIRAGRRL